MVLHFGHEIAAISVLRKSVSAAKQSSIKPAPPVSHASTHKTQIRQPAPTQLQLASQKFGNRTEGRGPPPLDSPAIPLPGDRAQPLLARARHHNRGMGVQARSSSSKYVVCESGQVPQPMRQARTAGAQRELGLGAAPRASPRPNQGRYLSPFQASDKKRERMLPPSAGLPRTAFARLT